MKQERQAGLIYTWVPEGGMSPAAFLISLHFGALK
jgi:hypothetical protein